MLLKSWVSFGIFKLSSSFHRLYWDHDSSLRSRRRTVNSTQKTLYLLARRYTSDALNFTKTTKLQKLLGFSYII